MKDCYVKLEQQGLIKFNFSLHVYYMGQMTCKELATHYDILTSLSNKN
jgi:hypothetical protein